MLKKIAIIGGWLALWQLASSLIGTSIILAGPYESLLALARDIGTAEFWQTIGFTFARIAAGFAISALLAVIFAIWAWKAPLVGEILSPAVSFIKSVPIVCIIVLLLIWVGSRHVSIIAVALMVFPPLYYGLFEGLKQSKKDMIDMLTVFHVSPWQRVRYYYIPLVMPQVGAALRVVIGIAWKSGVAAEVIGIPAGSIGENIYFAKISLETADLFAWTFVIVALAVACEKIILILVDIATDCATSRIPASYRLSAPAPSSQETDIVLDNISVSYGKEAVLSEVTNVFPASGRICVMGASGIGKTTLLNVICGLIPLRSGRLIAPERVSRVFQEDRLIPSLSAWDNVRLVAPMTSNTKDEWKADLDALIGADSAHLLPEEMSGGMKRKVALVRALAFPSNALILDEPFTGLDIHSKEEAVNLILKHLEQRTLIVSTHNPSDAQELGASVFSLDKTAATTS